MNAWRWQTGFWTIVTAIAPLAIGLPGKSQIPVCAPPNAGEYLLFVLSRTPDSQAMVRSKLPTDVPVSVCDYQGSPVTRLGGYQTDVAANAWAQYLGQSTGLQTVVVKPRRIPAVAPSSATPGNSGNPTAAMPQSSAPSNPAPSNPAPSNNPAATNPAGSPASNPAKNPIAPTGQPQSTQSAIATTYNPQAIASGYAVLVNYQNRPEVATQLHQGLNKDIGLVAYGQKPYLLALHTTDAVAANSVMQLLSDRGYLTMVVDARRVVLLKSAVSLK
ncbi:hypothetical protein ACN4EG_09190 [Alkalinema pantanalense CENA528]|uniref:hypothetical protein n=1 Tax=Alkalinema pantanalense TaxID=1620705 RepID=UPI003D6FB94E